MFADDGNADCSYNEHQQDNETRPPNHWIAEQIDTIVWPRKRLSLASNTSIDQFQGLESIAHGCHTVADQMRIELASYYNGWKVCLSVCQPFLAPSLLHGHGPRLRRSSPWALGT